MAKYCVAYINFFDNELKQTVINSDAEELRDVLYQYMWGIGYRGIINLDYASLIKYAYDCDAMIGVIKIESP